MSEDVAKQMWLNYIDALTDKVKRTGHHNFGKLGTLTSEMPIEEGEDLQPATTTDPLRPVRCRQDPLSPWSEAPNPQPVPEETPNPNPQSRTRPDTR